MHPPTTQSHPHHHMLHILIFCQVIDNWGDMGVCLRLSHRFLALGHHVTLAVNNPETLQALRNTWLSVNTPSSNNTSSVHHAIFSIVRWHPSQDTDTSILDTSTVALSPIYTTATAHAEAHQAAKNKMQAAVPDIIIATFGTRIPNHYHAILKDNPTTSFYNLEYLTAETWAQDVHGSQSIHPQWGTIQTYLCPSFHHATAGLIHPYFTQTASLPISLDANALHISVFCYPSFNLHALLTALQHNASAIARPVHVWLTAGQASHLFKTQHPTLYPTLHIHTLPMLSQANYFQLLQACDLNVVRGEDSATLAQFTGKPFIWQLYEQDNLDHLDKLNAWLNVWDKEIPPLSTAEASAIHAWKNVLHQVNTYAQHANAHSSLFAAYSTLITQLNMLNQCIQRWSHYIHTLPDTPHVLLHHHRQHL